jgi:hypothetical protein
LENTTATEQKIIRVKVGVELAKLQTLDRQLSRQWRALGDPRVVPLNHHQLSPASSRRWL